MKKALFLSLLMVLVGGTILSACGKSTPTPAPTVTVTAPAVTAPAPTVTVTTPAPTTQAKPIEITIVGDEPIDHALSVGALKFIKMVEERSQGRIKGKYFPAGQLMTRDKWIEALSAGTGVGFGWYTLSLYTRYDTRFLLPSLPYAIASMDEFLAFTRSNIAKEMATGLEKNNLRAVAYFSFDQGAVMAKKPLLTPDDYKGLKIRVSKSPTEEAMWKRMGASTVAIPFSEVPTAVQQGTVDAVASGTSVWGQLADLLKYGHDRPVVWPPWLVVTNKPWWDKLPPDLQGIMEGAMRETADDFNATAVAASLNFIKAAEAKKGVWVKLSSEQQAKLKEVAMSAWPDFQADIGKDLLDRFRQKGW